MLAEPGTSGYKSFNSQFYIKPVQVGHQVNINFSNDQARWQQFYNGAQTQGPVWSFSLNDRPMVVVFCRACHGDQAVNLLQQLNNIHADIRANGGRLVVVTPDHDDQLEKLAWQYCLLLNFYADVDGLLAKSFNLFYEAAEVPLHATYVVNTEAKVTYCYAKAESPVLPDINELIGAVYQSALMANAIQTV